MGSNTSAGTRRICVGGSRSGVRASPASSSAAAAAALGVWGAGMQRARWGVWPQSRAVMVLLGACLLMHSGLCIEPQGSSRASTTMGSSMGSSRGSSGPEHITLRASPQPLASAVAVAAAAAAASKRAGEVVLRELRSIEGSAADSGEDSSSGGGKGGGARPDAAGAGRQPRPPPASTTNTNNTNNISNTDSTSNTTGTTTADTTNTNDATAANRSPSPPPSPVKAQPMPTCPRLSGAPPTEAYRLTSLRSCPLVVQFFVYVPPPSSASAAAGAAGAMVQSADGSGSSSGSKQGKGKGQGSRSGGQGESEGPAAEGRGTPAGESKGQQDQGMDKAGIDADADADGSNGGDERGERASPPLCATASITNNSPQETLYGWQLVWHWPQRGVFTAADVQGAELITNGDTAPVRVINSIYQPSMPPGNSSNFSLAITPTAPASLTDSADVDASSNDWQSSAQLDWSAVFANGQRCYRLPSSSFNLKDCTNATYDSLTGGIGGGQQQVLCASLFCCGDFVMGGVSPPLDWWLPGPGNSSNRSGSSSSGGVGSSGTASNDTSSTPAGGATPTGNSTLIPDDLHSSSSAGPGNATVPGGRPGAMSQAADAPDPPARVIHGPGGTASSSSSSDDHSSSGDASSQPQAELTKPHAHDQGGAATNSGDSSSRGSSSSKAGKYVPAMIAAPVGGAALLATLGLIVWRARRRSHRKKQSLNLKLGHTIAFTTGSMPPAGYWPYAAPSAARGGPQALGPQHYSAGPPPPHATTSPTFSDAVSGASMFRSQGQQQWHHPAAGTADEFISRGKGEKQCELTSMGSGGGYGGALVPGGLAPDTGFSHYDTAGVALGRCGSVPLPSVGWPSLIAQASTSPNELHELQRPYAAMPPAHHQQAVRAAGEAAASSMHQQAQQAQQAVRGMTLHMLLLEEEATHLPAAAATSVGAVRHLTSSEIQIHVSDDEDYEDGGPASAARTLPMAALRRHYQQQQQVQAQRQQQQGSLRLARAGRSLPQAFDATRDLEMQRNQDQGWGQEQGQGQGQGQGTHATRLQPCRSLPAALARTLSWATRGRGSSTTSAASTSRRGTGDTAHPLTQPIHSSPAAAAGQGASGAAGHQHGQHGQHGPQQRVGQREAARRPTPVSAAMLMSSHPATAIFSSSGGGAQQASPDPRLLLTQPAATMRPATRALLLDTIPSASDGSVSSHTITESMSICGQGGGSTADAEPTAIAACPAAVQQQPSQQQQAYGTTSLTPPHSLTSAADGNMVPQTHHPHPQPQTHPQQQVWVSIDFAREVVLDAKLGSGTFGTVYSAVWTHNRSAACMPGASADAASPVVSGGMRVAVKLVRLMMDASTYCSASFESLKQEVKVLSRLHHPHIVQFYGACLVPPNVCIVEELAEGGSLYALLHSKRKRRAACAGGAGGGGEGNAPSAAGGASDGRLSPLSCGQVLQMGVEVASAMAYMHEASVVHRDLKSQNVLLDAQGRAKVCDFGIAKFKERTFLSTRNVHAGTPQYMAPEQFEGGRVDEKVDVYAYGVLLWEALTGQQPWGDLHNPMQIIFVVGVQGQRPPLPPSCPPALASLIAACWADSPADRPPFTAVLDRLKAIQAQTS